MVATSMIRVREQEREDGHMAARRRRRLASSCSKGPGSFRAASITGPAPRWLKKHDGCGRMDMPLFLGWRLLAEERIWSS